MREHGRAAPGRCAARAAAGRCGRRAARLLHLPDDAFETAYASFCRQTYARTELLVFETGGDPSPRAAKTCTSLYTGTYDVGERELAEIVGLVGELFDAS